MFLPVSGPLIFARLPFPPEAVRQQILSRGARRILRQIKRSP